MIYYHEYQEGKNINNKTLLAQELSVFILPVPFGKQLQLSFQTLHLCDIKMTCCIRETTKSYYYTTSTERGSI